MRVGPKRWWMVSIDSSGVPTGGRYGNVRRFARRAGRHGLKVCWSVLHHCFGIYTQEGPNTYTFQLLWRDAQTNEAKPLSDKLLWYLLYLWNQKCREGSRILEQAYKGVIEKRNQEIAKAKYEAMTRHAREVGREARIQSGKRTRDFYSIPAHLGVSNG